MTGRRALQRAVAAGAVRRPRLGVCALPTLDETEAVVRATGGIRSHLSAAVSWGWPVKWASSLPVVTVRHGTRLRPDQRVGVRVHYGTWTAQERADGRTGAVRTVVDCARSLAFDEALAVADSALRARDVTQAALRRMADASPRTGRRRAMRVAEYADARADNPFESVLRAIALDVPGLDPRPQLAIGGDSPIGTPDLVDVEHRLVIEAESWEFHGGRAAFERDVRRYTAMTRAGWRVARFVWADVMQRPESVRVTLVDLIEDTRSRL